MNRLQVLYKLDDLVDGHCKNCEEIKKVNGNARAQYCIKNCEVGKEIRQLGTLLGKKKQEREGEKMEKKQVTKEQYLALGSVLSDNEKAKELGIGYSTLCAYKKEWGLTKSRKGKENDYEAVKQEVKEAVAVNPEIEESLKKRIAELEKEVEMYKPYQAKVEQLEAAAGDLENENAAHIDKIVELERGLNQKESHERWNEILTTENARLTTEVKNQQEQINTLISVLGVVAK